ncbi:chorismate-binding protein [Aquimarina longa]|uniref:chorismate-binding protein n=1 Tax=Aquimarina longa TaxID=1080221 RepID=UPI0007811F7D|nr:chorismate-binding protein [Aquimarina longa]
MNINDVYTKIQTQLEQQLPFVVYRKANSNKLKAFFQKNNEVHTIEEYSTSGFIFAPFDSANQTIIIPLDKSEYYNVTIPEENALEHKKNIATIEIKEQAYEKEKHVQLVKKGIKAITSGAFKKVVLSRKEETLKPNSLTNLQVFQNLIKYYPKAFVYFWFHPSIGTWMGATPETLLRVSNNNFSTMALAGTQPYTTTLDVDWGVKEKVEQKIVTDYIVSRLSLKFKTVQCSETYTYKAGTLLHLCTDINGVFDHTGGSTIKDIIDVLHPTPAVCGLPKDEAKSFIYNNEKYDRKYYTGFLGELNIDIEGVLQTNIYVNLRCMEIKEDIAILYIGGGITKDSNAEKEWEETIRKTETMKRVLF